MRCLMLDVAYDLELQVLRGDSGFLECNIFCDGEIFAIAGYDQESSADACDLRPRPAAVTSSLAIVRRDRIGHLLKEWPSCSFRFNTHHGIPFPMDSAIHYPRFIFWSNLIRG